MGEIAAWVELHHVATDIKNQFWDVTALFWNEVTLIPVIGCCRQEEELKKAILVVFANKQDMEQAMTPTEVANSLGLPALKDRKWQIFKTSATKGTGLDEAMEWWDFF